MVAFRRPSSYKTHLSSLTVLLLLCLASTITTVLSQNDGTTTNTNTQTVQGSVGNTATATTTSSNSNNNNSANANSVATTTTTNNNGSKDNTNNNSQQQQQEGTGDATITEDQAESATNTNTNNNNNQATPQTSNTGSTDTDTDTETTTNENQSQTAQQPVAQAQSSSDQATIYPYDCYDPNNRDRVYRVRRGEMTTVCLYVGPGGDWNRDLEYKRFSVNLIADEFSSYEVPGSYIGITESLEKNETIHLFSASQSSLSFMRRYWDESNGRIYPYLTAILDVKDGVVMGITWDDACIFCEQKECLPNTFNFDGSVATQEQASQPVNGCYMTKTECEASRIAGLNKCDLKLYVAWTGTDADGNVLLSSNSRFSAFPPNRVQENVKGQYDSMVKKLEDLKSKLPGGKSNN